MKKKILIVVLIIIFIVLTLCVWAVIQNNKAEKNGIFMRHTMINGVDCSKLDVRQSVEKLTAAIIRLATSFAVIGSLAFALRS